MKTIWKATGLEWPKFTPFTISMPQGAQVISAQLQHGLIALWAIVDPEARTEDRRVLLAPTGMNVDLSGMTFVDTVQDQQGLVWHVFVEDVT